MTVTRRVAAPAMPTRRLVHRLPAARHYAVSKLPVAGPALDDPAVRRDVLLTLAAVLTRALPD